MDVPSQKTAGQPFSTDEGCPQGEAHPSSPAGDGPQIKPTNELRNGQRYLVGVFKTIELLFTRLSLNLPG